MSWSGFKKAVNRAGAHVIMKSSHAEPTADLDFDNKEHNFHLYESIIADLNSEFANFNSSIDSLLQTNYKIAKAIDSFHGDYNFDLQHDNLIGSSTSNTDSTNNINQRDGISLTYLQNSHHSLNNLNSKLSDPLNQTIFEPLQQLIDYNTEIHKLIKKRGRKKFDYDVALSKRDKLLAEHNQLQLQLQLNSNLNSNSNPSSQLSSDDLIQLNKSNDKLTKSQSEFKTSSIIYNDINTRLKNEIDEYIALRFSLLDPSFHSFIKIQQNLYSDLNNILSKDIKFDAQSNFQKNNNSLDDSLDEILLKMKSLDINNL